MRNESDDKIMVWASGIPEKLGFGLSNSWIEVHRKLYTCNACRSITSTVQARKISSGMDERTLNVH
jgi:hypothetical protein